MPASRKPKNSIVLFAVSLVAFVSFFLSTYFITGVVGLIGTYRSNDEGQLSVNLDFSNRCKYGFVNQTGQMVEFSGYWKRYFSAVDENTDKRIFEAGDTYFTKIYVSVMDGRGIEVSYLFYYVGGALLSEKNLDNPLRKV